MTTPGPTSSVLNLPCWRCVASKSCRGWNHRLICETSCPANHHIKLYQQKLLKTIKFQSFPPNKSSPSKLKAFPSTFHCSQQISVISPPKKTSPSKRQTESICKKTFSVWDPPQRLVFSIEDFRAPNPRPGSFNGSVWNGGRFGAEKRGVQFLPPGLFLVVKGATISDPWRIQV